MPGKRTWNIVSSHGAVVLIVAENPASTMREISAVLHITERQVARIVRDLVDGGILRVTRRGLGNVYSIIPAARFRRPVLSHITVGEFAALMCPPALRALEAAVAGG